MRVIGELNLDAEGRLAKIRGTPVFFNEREFAILLYLSERAGMVTSKDQILHQAFGKNADAAASGVKVFIHRIRKKLAQHSPDHDYIQTIGPYGYLFEGPRTTRVKRDLAG
jgi:DNA-binding response OmpR family regulator